MLASEQLDPIAIRTLLTTHGTHLDPESEEANLVGTYNTLRSRQIEIPGTAQPTLANIHDQNQAQRTVSLNILPSAHY
ncbi:hypothetical protein MJO29_016493 [Puccinia striiformis f. sp. tritici]|nr:hypothetical protein MJO29_016493 [Puccinia striiformis f. sp. tritici]